MFARLSGTNLCLPSRSAKELPSSGSDKSDFPFESFADTATIMEKAPGSEQAEVKAQQPLDSMQVELEHLQDRNTHAQSSVELHDTGDQSGSQIGCDDEYLRKAAAYLNAFPCKREDTAYTIKTVAAKLHTAYTPDTAEFGVEELEKLRSRYVFAIVNYVNKKVKINSELLSIDSVKKILREKNGDFLQFCAALVESKFISLGSLDHIAHLCQNILDMLPKADASPVADSAGIPKATTTTASAPPNAPVTTLPIRAPDDPMGSMTAGPTQERREHGMSQTSPCRMFFRELTRHV